MAPSRHDWKIVDWDVKPQHNQPYDKLDYLCIAVVIKAIVTIDRESCNVSSIGNSVFNIAIVSRQAFIYLDKSF